MSNLIYSSSPSQGTVIKLMLYFQFQTWDYEGTIKHSKYSQNPKKIKELMTDTVLAE